MLYPIAPDCPRAISISTFFLTSKVRPTITTKPEADGEAGKPAVPLRQLLWRSYVRTALIPLLVIELGFLTTYWVSATVVYDDNVDAVSDLSRRYFQDIAHREAGTISTRLEAVASHTRVFARQSLTALEGDYMPPASERARYTMMPDGVLYTTRDNGTTASIYSNRTRIGPAEMAKVWRLSALDPFMKATVESNPLISSVYFNSFDSYNRIYPYFDVLEQYPRDINVPAYNFYYDADAEHNPERRDVWTDAYVDPAGHGWMVSSIAPVWRGDTLEGVVGIDVTLETLIDSLLNLNLPWGSYAVLVDESGGIIALPPSGEDDFGLSELTSHHYAEAIQSDTFKPDTFNIYRREDTQALAAAMKRASEGEVELQLGGRRLASFDTVPQTGWKLVVIAPTERIFADARNLNQQLKTVGYVMLAVLLAFYLLFFAFLLVRARKMSELIASPLTEIAGLIDNIGQRGNDPRFAGSQVEELDKLGHQLVATERRLITAEDETRAQSRVAGDAVAQLREANGEMVRFTRQMSHQIRTPLSIIDGSVQIIQRKAASMSPDDLRHRADRLRGTVSTIADLLTRLVDRFDAIAADLAKEQGKGATDLRGEVAAMAAALIPTNRLRLYLPPESEARVDGAGPLLIALREVLENAIRHSEPDSPVTVALDLDDGRAQAAVTNLGGPAADLDDSAWERRRKGTRSPAEQSLGVGLAIARKALADYDGTLKIMCVDEVTTVTIAVPIGTAPLAQAQPQSDD